MKKRERQGEQKGHSTGLISSPYYRHTAADDYELYLEHKYEWAKDWLQEYKRLRALGVPFERMPLEISEACAWVFRNEKELILVGLRPRCTLLEP